MGVAAGVLEEQRKVWGFYQDQKICAVITKDIPLACWCSGEWVNPDWCAVEVPR